MHPCPVCQRKIEYLHCPDCGFDGSLDYEHYPTLEKVPDQTDSISRRIENRKDLLRCPDCQSNAFSFSVSQAAFCCLQCGKVILADTVIRPPTAEKAAERTAPRQTSTVEAQQSASDPSNKFANLQFGKNYEPTEKPVFPRQDTHKSTIDLAGENLGIDSLSAEAKERLASAAKLFEDLDCLYDSPISYGGSHSLKINAVAAGERHTVALYDNGTVSLTPGPFYEAESTKDWTEIVSVSADTDITVGLRQDGTILIACGKGKGDHLREAERWNDLIAVAANYTHIIGLKKDGSVLAAGKNKHGQCNVSHWTDISAVSTDIFHTVGLRKDGSVIIAGDLRYGGRAAKTWQSLAAISAGTFHIVGLRRNGTVIASGKNKYGECNIQDWTDISAVATGVEHTVGLRKDGTVLAVGSNDKGQCAVEGWTEIVAIAAGSYHTVGLRKDGTLLATGDDLFNQCRVSWLRHY